MPKQTDVARWRVEISLSEEFRDNEFGKYSKDEITKAGENIEYFDKGFTVGHLNSDLDEYTTLNLFHAITKNVVPALYYQNPEVNVIPKRREDQPSSPIVREVLNHYFRETNAETVNKRIIWDSYVLGYGVYKIGYATKYGVDVIDEKEIEKRKQQTLLEKIGLRKPKEKEQVVHPELNFNIYDEAPYISYISPFDFLIDPRARSIEDAQWVAHVVRKTVESIKKNPKYKNTSKINGMYEPSLPSSSHVDIPESVLDAFKTVDLYEIHYRQPDGMYCLVMVKDTGNEYKEIYHEKSPYEMDGFQFDVLTFNKHEHKLYPISDLSKIKNLQDRFTSTMDSILNQVDRFVPKIAADQGKLGPDAQRELREGDVGAIVWTNGNPQDVIREVSFTQLKGDLLAVLDRVIDITTIQTGVTKSKLLGVSMAETATGETISQGGETLRLMDMTQDVTKFINKQATKMWQVVKQFAPIEELNIIIGESGIDQQTGQTLYNWLPDIDSAQSERLAKGEFRFEMVVGSSQRHDIAYIRKQLENLTSIIANSDAIMMAQQQGIKIDIGEWLRMILRQYPEVVRDPNKIIQTISPQTQGLLQPEEGTQGGPTSGSGMNALRSLQAQPTPSPETMASGASQI